MKRLLCAVSAAVLLSSAASAGSEESLFDAANVIHQSAEDQPLELQAATYGSVRTILAQVVAEYPTPDLAVRVTLKDTIDGVDVRALDSDLEATKAQETPADSESEVAGTSSSETQVDAGEVQTLELSALPMETVEPDLPARSEEEIVTDVQTELNRFECPAGPTDGVVGRKTRPAFSNTLKDSGSELANDDLITEAALAELKQPESTVCKTRTMTTTPASALAGSWGFRSDCTGLGNTVIRYSGNNTLRGPARLERGLNGNAVIQFQAGRTAATIIKFGVLTLQGNLTRSTRNTTISGTGSNRCEIAAWKN